MKFNPTQENIALHYCGGEFAHITDTDESDDCGDTLFTFCIREAGDAESQEEFLGMLARAIDELRSLQGELE